MELLLIIGARLHLLHKWRFPSHSKKISDRAYTGRYSEYAAASWLRAHGLKVLRQNFRRGHRGEIDLVCRHRDTLVFVEVKSSTARSHGQARRHVNYTKRVLLRHGARQWLLLLGRTVPIRFDLIEVYLQPGEKPEITHTPRAFTMREGDAAQAAGAQPTSHPAP